MATEQAEKRGQRLTRRRFAQIGLEAAAFTTGAAATGAAALLVDRFVPSSLLPPQLLPPGLLPPPVPFKGVIREDLVYTRFDTDQWWNAKEGMPVRARDFEVWHGASAVWRGLFQEDVYVPGTGFPALVIRVPRVDTYFEIPDRPSYSLPPGFGLFYDDPARDLRIVAGLDRCTHLCCFPGWHVVNNPPPGRDYLLPSPTYAVYAQDPIYCLCHGTQYDPLVLIEDVNPRNNATFPGMQLVHGPGSFAMPLIPLRAREDDILQGGAADSRWYAYC